MWKLDNIRSDQQHLADLDIARHVEDALWRSDLYRAAGRDTLTYTVLDGHVILRGHVASPMLRSQIEAWVRAAPGVRSVSNELVADADLTVAVAQALAHDPLTRPHRLRVGAHNGWIQLGGEVPTEEAQAAAEAAASAVPQVRGVLTLPRLTGATPPRARRPLQPRVGQPVYARDGSAGRVAQVVVNPVNRLVSHLIVNTRFELGERPIRHQVVVPAEALTHVTEAGAFVADTLQGIAARPVFRTEDFQRPGWQWQPPYPYDWGELLWPVQPHYYLLPQRVAETRAAPVSAA